MKQLIRMTTQRSLRLFLLVGLSAGLLGAAGSAPAFAASTSITIISGGGSGGVGTPDPVTTYSIPSARQGSAVIMTPHFSYTTIPGTRWVNTSGVSNTVDQGSSQTTTYTVHFTLPANFVSPSITVQVLADNEAVVSLNGTEIGRQPHFVFSGPELVNFQTISTFPWSNSSDFVDGVNSLSIANLDYGGANGVDFKAVVMYDTAPEPCTPGMYNNGNGCVEADPGYYVPVSGATEQTPCALGTYQPNAGAVSCILADPGHYVDVTAAVMQIDCVPGSYQPNSGATSCILAEAGFFVPEPAMTEQYLCPRGTTSLPGATECTSAFFNFSGFLQPVDNLPALNQVKAGQAIPVKFGLGGDQGLNILASGSPSSVKIACDGSATIDVIEQTVMSGGSSLSYDALTDTYTYVWKTDKSWANTCRQLTVTLTDGTVHEAHFKFK
ncbi:MAG TPA: PxKF domain-containing protein [Anaerolineales bacterium]|nr:PxKF domain-containing protein [Anaerolineales bacterium]